MKRPLQLPARALAEEIAAEWLAQDDKIDPSTLPLTRLANTAIDGAAAIRSAVIEEIVKFAGSDLVCYRASALPRLREREAGAWDPVLVWAEREIGAKFEVAHGIVFRSQPTGALLALKSYLDRMSPWELTAILNMTTLTGSALLAAGAIAGESAWGAAHLDEDWQIEHWGVDAEAQARRSTYRQEFDLALRFLALSRI
jgi:chaperone required for assembly of F1-ATPase